MFLFIFQLLKISTGKTLKKFKWLTILQNHTKTLFASSYSKRDVGMYMSHIESRPCSSPSVIHRKGHSLSQNINLMSNFSIPGNLELR